MRGGRRRSNYGSKEALVISGRGTEKIIWAILSEEDEDEKETVVGAWKRNLPPF